MRKLFGLVLIVVAVMVLSACGMQSIPQANAPISEWGDPWTGFYEVYIPEPTHGLTLDDVLVDELGFARLMDSPSCPCGNELESGDIGIS